MKKEVKFIDKHKAAEITGLSPWTLRNYRLRGELIQGIHWVKLNPRVVRYNAEMISKWMVHGGNSVEDIRAAQEYLKLWNN